MTEDNVGGIFVANAIGRRPIRLTRVQSDPRNPVLDAHPRWSADGRRIVFHRYRTTGSTVYVVNAKGGGLRSLGDGYDPSWSPDGKRIALAAKPPDSDTFNIYVMRPDGRNRTRLTTNPEGDSNPEWSPDGKLIAFDGTAQRDSDIYLVRADGTSRRRLTTTSGADVDATWSPDGKRIVFASRRVGGQFDLYIMKTDGSQQTRLTQLPGEEAQPSWQRRPPRNSRG
jgi:TolB protein